MALKVDISREFPELESITPKDKQKLILFLSTIFDELETISRRAQEAGALAEKLQAEQQTLLKNLGMPSVTSAPDAVIGAFGNLSGDLKLKVIAGAPFVNDGYIAVKDNLGNTINLMTKA